MPKWTISRANDGGDLSFHILTWDSIVQKASLSLQDRRSWEFRGILFLKQLIGLVFLHIPRNGVLVAGDMQKTSYEDFYLTL